MFETKLELLEEKLKTLETIILSKKLALTLNEASLYLGLSKSCLYKLTSNNIIPHYKPNGKVIYFDRTELEQWMLKNKT